MPSRAQAHRPGKKLGLSYYHKPADQLAQELLGKVLVRLVGDQERRARIVETEAYTGPQDLACHSSKGLTSRTSVMFGPAGHAYVYLIYGMYQMLNITSGEGQAVLLRAAEPLDGWTANLSGPGRLARALGITRADNGIPLTGQALHLIDLHGPPVRIVRRPRIGVDYAQHWKDALLRFYDADSSAVSKPR